MKIHPVNALFYFSPLALLAAQVWILWQAFAGAAPWGLSLAALLVVTYFVPVLAHRLVSATITRTPQWAEFDLSRPNAWFCSIRLQIYFITFPQWEEVLRWIPGAYSGWLRLWGSRIGRNVHWSPQSEVLDRGLLEIDDDVQIGHRAVLAGHYIDHRDERRFLYLRKVRVGPQTLIGAYSIIGPGAEIPPHSFIRLRSVLVTKGQPE